MTSIEQADNLLFLLNRANAGASFSYSDKKLSQVLTMAQWHYIYSFVNKKSNAGMSGLEETEIRGQGLSNLMRQALDLPSYTPQSMYENSRVFDLPEDFMWAIDETVLLSNKDCEDVRALVIPVRHDEVARNIRNIYKKPVINAVDARVWRIYHNYKEYIPVIYHPLDDVEKTSKTTKINRHELILPVETTNTKYSLRYLKLPESIIVDKNVGSNNVDCELDPQVHQTIVEIARDIMLDTVKEQKSQSTVDLENLE